MPGSYDKETMLRILFQRNGIMRRVSIRTLTLLLVLLLGVVSHQYLAAARGTETRVLWLAGDCPSIERHVPVGTGCSVNP